MHPALSDPFLMKQIACGAFLLLLGAARLRYFRLAGFRTSSSERLNWGRHLPAYAASALWIAYVAWFVLDPRQAQTLGAWTGAAPVLLAWTGIALIVAGLALFLYSHHVIGRYWSIVVQVKQRHRLVTEGPYRYVRHPLYSAFFIAYLGTALTLQSWLLLAGFPVFVLSYVLFAREEERVMEQGFGETYRGYRGRTGMFLPRLRRRVQS